MKCKKTVLLISEFLFLIQIASLSGQPLKSDPNTGDPKWRKRGIMDGNMAKTLFYNDGEIGRYREAYSGEWPKGSGHLYIDGVAVIVQAECIDNNGDTIHPMETMYYEFMDVNPETNEPMGWAPVPGYCNYYQDSPALSDDPESWPDHWPDKPPEWAGYWNGYFGKGVKNADLETYFVMDDDQDVEWNFYPDSSDTSRRGLGMEVACRGFQWSHVLAEDCIFWHFAITNESTYDYKKVLFGYYIDWGIGETMPEPGGSDDCGSYDTDIDLAYAWAYNNSSQWGGKAGYAGFAYLESPGNPWDGVDNDDDGLIDESRESGPGDYIYGSCGYYDEKGNMDRETGLKYRDHWSGDEDGDWRAFTDIDENGVWDLGEPLNDDLGKDGIGPMDEGYNGSDEGEGDGIPTPGEPNFDQTDKDEADQIGLTGFRIFNVHDYELHDEKTNWEVLSKLEPPTPEQLLGTNLGMFFSSGLFPLYPEETQRFSMALLFGYDEDDLRRNKKTVQAIYNANYNFSRPPDKPRLTAIPGDGKVILYWDDGAEASYDRYLQEYDFEGYRIYRSTEPSFLESRLITDAYGNPTFRKPLAQFDLKNDLEGPHLIGVYGAHFNLGNDSGLRHTFIDSTVKNGQTYYYAVVSYDYGFISRDEDGNVRFDSDGNPIGIPPTECTSTLMIDETGAIKADVNTAAVTPNAPAAGYSPPALEGEIKHRGPGTGSIDVVFIAPGSVKDSAYYKVVFSDTSGLHLDKSPGYIIIRDTLPDNPSSPPETLVADLNVRGVDEESPLFDGMALQLHNDTSAFFIDSLSGWQDQQNNYKIDVGFNSMFTSGILNLNRPSPSDFKLIFSDTIVSKSTALLGSYKEIPTNFSLWNVTGDSLEQPFLFDDKNKDSLFGMGEAVTILIKDTRSIVNYWTTWELCLSGPPAVYETTYIDEDSFVVDTTYLKEPIPPQSGDVYNLITTHPFRGDWLDAEGDTLPGDVFEFLVRREYLSEKNAKEELKKVAVVPNPYVVAASWEAPSPYQFGRGERKIDFIHLPQKCTIRIYTVRGNLIKTIKHVGTMRDGAEPWDLRSKEGLDISYGLYIYHIDAPGIGEKIGKFAVIK